MQDEGYKRCTQCGEIKPLTEFYKRGDNTSRYRSHCKLCVRASNLAWSEANRERHRAMSSDWQRRNRPRTNARWREWKKRSGYNWCALNPERAREMWRADAQRRALGRDVDAVAYADVLRADPCCYCGAPCEHIDHITPVTIGGTNHWTNLTAACAACNSRKQDTAMLEFLRRAISTYRRGAGGSAA